MEHYVTLFDSLFLPQGLALHCSMERHCEPYTLWVLCVDDAVHQVLTKLDLPNIRLLQLSMLETRELKSVKTARTKGEYCWTLTPFAPRFVFEADPSVNRVTYLDADLWFRKNPALIFAEFELSSKQVLITDHAYAPEYDLSATSGQYCVQFVTFVRNASEVVRKWWEDRCIEWCFGYFEDGKFGDQMYLDDWPLRFCNDVHVLDNKELTLAPWNARQFPYGNAVFFHFHGLRIASRRKLNLGKFYLPGPVIKHVYGPYISELKEAVNRLEEAGFSLQAQAQPLGIMRRALWCLTFLYRHFQQAIPKHTLKW